MTENRSAVCDLLLSEYQGLAPRAARARLEALVLDPFGLLDYCRLLEGLAGADPVPDPFPDGLPSGLRHAVLREGPAAAALDDDTLGLVLRSRAGLLDLQSAVLLTRDRASYWYTRVVEAEAAPPTILPISGDGEDGDGDPRPHRVPAGGRGGRLALSPLALAVATGRRRGCRVRAAADPPAQEDEALTGLLLRARSELAARAHTKPAGQTAFAEFVERTHPRLARCILPLVDGDVHEAEDIAQEAYLKVWKQLPVFDPQGQHRPSVFRWLVRLARGEAVSRSRRKRPAVAADVERRGLPDDPFAWPGRRGREADPALQAEYNEQARAILAAVAQLGDRQRELFQLRYRDRLSYRQIADMCDLTPGQVGSLLSSARRQVRARVRKAAVTSSS